VQRPFIHINLAADEEGRVASASGAPLAISCREDWRRVHGLRESFDAVAVGARTWILDSPGLNVRRERLGREPLRQPARVIFAGGHRCAVEPDGRRTFVVGSSVPELENLVHITARCRRLGEPLRRLRRHGIRSMLVEGGPTLLLSFPSAGYADGVTLYVRTRHVEAALAASVKLRIEFPPWDEARPLGRGVLLVGRARAGGEFLRNETRLDGEAAGAADVFERAPADETSPTT